MAFTKGEIVLSLKGRDAGRLFCVLDARDGFATVADGKGRKLAAPKRKRETHLAGVGTSAHPAILGLQRGESVSDRALRAALAAFRDSEQTIMEGNQFV
ncbi:MAG: KOW domain-containing RNA-binding protein [Oscillospiraceae bacterium]|nr:KOW domain-containing RNA-binding protein [Oscillospiraceae bacterium]